MRALLLLSIALALGTTAVPGAQAKAPATFCGKVVHNGRGTIDRRVNGVTVWHRGLVIHACSDRFRRAYVLLIADQGVRVALVRAARQRCVAIVLTKAGTLPEIVLKDLAAKRDDSIGQTVGFGAASASVGSLAVSSNCAAAWGQTIIDASGAATSSVVAKGFGAATSLTAAVSEVAIVAGPDDTKDVAIAAAGRGVTVSWREGGQSRAVSLP
jgi:hypothetical protein